MAELLEALQSGIKAGFCTLSAPVEKTLQLGENWYNNADLPGAPDGPTPLGEGLRAARNILCGEPPQDVSNEFVSLLPNGQCPGTTYLVSADAVINGNSPIPAGTSVGTGPMVRDKGANVPTGARDLIRDADGDLMTGGGTNSPGGTYELINISITPTDGPDDCGASPEQPPESYNVNDFTTNIDIDYDPPDGGPQITIPVGFVYAPVDVDVDGRLVVPVDLDVGGINVKANLDLSNGDINFVQNISNTKTTVEVDPTIVVQPGEPGGDPPTEEEENQRNIIGVYVQTTTVGPIGEKREILPNNGGPSIYGPRLGSVMFKCETLVGPGLAWTQDIDIKAVEQVIYCPIPWGAKQVIVEPQPGVTMRFVPIVGDSERSLLLQAADAAVVSG